LTEVCSIEKSVKQQFAKVFKSTDWRAGGESIRAAPDFTQAHLKLAD
jgi:hypothetical protein